MGAKMPLFLSLLLAGCATVASSGASAPSVLNKDAARLDGETIHAVGWIVLEAEEVALWDGKRDREQGRDAGKCVSLLLPEELAGSLKRFNRSQVTVTGRFHKDVASFDTTLFTGLCNVTAIEIESVDGVKAAR